MKSIKHFFLAVLWLVLITAGIYIAYQRQAFASVPQVQQVLTLIFEQGKESSDTQKTSSLELVPLNTDDRAKLETAFTDATAQLKMLSARGQETGQMSSQVLGEFIQVNQENDEKSTSEKALEYGRYLYCQQVVKEWEENTSSQ